MDMVAVNIGLYMSGQTMFPPTKQQLKSSAVVELRYESAQIHSCRVLLYLYSSSKRHRRATRCKLVKRLFSAKSFPHSNIRQKILKYGALRDSNMWGSSG